VLYLSLDRFVFYNRSAREPYGRGWGAETRVILFSPKTPPSSVSGCEYSFLSHIVEDEHR
jgi:hypothetical protein